MTGLSDSFQRPINYLRISVTDRCNLRCIYCMPDGGVPQVSHEDILTYEEIAAVAEAASEVGIDKVRLTGGEPLVRLNLSALVKMLARIKRIDDISLSTNGTLLKNYAGELKAAGLKRVNISLDTLKPDRFRAITRSEHELGDVLAGLEAAHAAGLTPVKINVVVIRGKNDDEIADFALKTIHEGWHVRFIELMPVKGLGLSELDFVPVAEMRKRLEPLGPLEPCLPSAGNGPAKYLRFTGSAGSIGFITPVSEHFCFKCNRLRLTADGRLRPCLLADDEVDLRRPLRQGASAAEIKQLVEQAAAAKPRRHGLDNGCMPQGGRFSETGG